MYFPKIQLYVPKHDFIFLKNDFICPKIVLLTNFNCNFLINKPVLPPPEVCKIQMITSEGLLASNGTAWQTAAISQCHHYLIVLQYPFRDLKWMHLHLSVNRLEAHSMNMDVPMNHFTQLFKGFMCATLQ